MSGRCLAADLLPALTIGSYEPRHAPEIVALWRASFEHGVGVRDHHPIEQQMHALVEEVVPNCRVRLVLDEAGVAAFMASTPESIAHLYVRVSRIGQGIGGRLLRLAMRESSGSLWLYTFAQNVRARGFYEHHGFVEVDRECGNMWKLEAIRYVWRRAGSGGATDPAARQQQGCGE